MIAHIQYRRGLPATEGCDAAWRALEDRGWAIEPFERIDEVNVDPDHPVIGGVAQTVEALQRLGVTPPDIDYPPTLREHLLDPQVERTTMAAVRAAIDRWPLFVKPTTGRKEFTGRIVRRADDLIALAHVDDALDVFAARPVDLRGRVEWRAFVIDGEVRDVRPYSGRPDRTAPPAVLLSLLAQQWSGCPAGCSIDVVDLGSATAPDWRIVECNDGYALGSYGLHPQVYAELIVKRWAELTHGDCGWD